MSETYLAAQYPPSNRSYDALKDERRHGVIMTGRCIALDRLESELLTKLNAVWPRVNVTRVSPRVNVTSVSW